MKVFRISIVLISILVLSNVAWAMNVKTDYDRSFALGNLRTFSFMGESHWSRDPRETSLVDKRIKDSLIVALEKKGFRYDPNGHSDFLVAFYSREREKAQVEDYAYGFPHRWRWGWGPTLWTRYYTEGSVVVDFIDPSNNQLIWRGRATDTVKGLDPSEKQIEKGSNELVKHFLKDAKKEEKS